MRFTKMNVKEQLKNIVAEYKKIKAEGINMDKPEEKPTAAVVPEQPEEVKKEAEQTELPPAEEKPIEPVKPEDEVKKEQEVPAEEGSDMEKLTEVVEKLFEKIEAIEAKLASMNSEKPIEVPETEKQMEPPMMPIQERTSLNGANLGVFKEVYEENPLKENVDLMKAIKEVF